MSLRINLLKGPRIKTQATRDLEIVLSAYMYEQPPLHRINRYGEYEVDINGKVYNLSKIMEHKPDLEHLDLTLNARQSAFAEDYLYRLSKGYEPGEAAKELTKNARLTTAETRAIRVYTEHKLCYILNAFTRSDGKSIIPEDTKSRSDSDSESESDYSEDEPDGLEIKPDITPVPISLQAVLVVLALSTKALIKVRESSTGEAELLFRGEDHGSPYKTDKIIHVRTRATPVAFENAFYSTSTDIDVTYSHFSERNSPESIHIELGGESSKLGADITALSRYKEGEILFLPGTQIAYFKDPNSRNFIGDRNPYSDLKHSVKDVNTLQAVAVRSLDGIYADTYYKDIGRLRQQLVQLTESYARKNDHDPALLTIMDELCKNICVYGAAELFNSLAACRKFASEMKEFSFPEASKLVGEMRDILEKRFNEETKQSQSKLIEMASEINPTDLSHAVRMALYAPTILACIKIHAKNEKMGEAASSIDQQKLDLIQCEN